VQAEAPEDAKVPLPTGQFKGKLGASTEQPVVACVLAPHVAQLGLPTLLAYLFEPQGTQTEEEEAPIVALAVPTGQPVHIAWPCKLA